jgi:predicted ATPase/class 3 adenylate cyclase
VGTGVFLFTDMEGSTRQWASDTDAMRVTLEQHDVVLGEAVVAAGGSVFNHTGDGLACSFPSVGAAVIAAADGQRRLSMATWATAEPPRVRMAIHAGDADPRDGGWFGPALNRCARLMGIAHGGQVLLSGAARALLVEGMPAGLELVPLGSHRLRDLVVPEDVFQLVGAGLARAFPPLRSLESFHGSLPLQLTSFHGRQVEVDDLASTVIVRRLVTLIGPGGMGKTRLAIQAAAAVIDKFADGVWFIELAPVSEPEAVDWALVATLGLQPRPGESPRQLVVHGLAHWRALVVLDNCEQVLAAAADLAGELLRRCPGVNVLATSRQPLHSPGELVWTVGPLAVESDAVALFADRAGAARPDAVPDAAHGPVVEDVCRRLDGMPLAIELAAARLRSMSVTELAERLADRFRVLRTNLPAGETRHATLGAVLDWSYELLSVPERRLFDRLAVFAGGFDLPSAHAVCGEPEDDDLDTLELLDALVDKSLVQVSDQDGRTRYTVLETMRHYGAQRWTPSERESLGDRHAGHYAALAAQSMDGLAGPDDVAWVEWFDRDFDNLRAAFEWSINTGDHQTAVSIPGDLVYYNYTLPSEVWAWAARAEALPNVEHSPAAIRLLHHLAWARYFLGDPEGTIDYAERALALEAARGEPPNPDLKVVRAVGYGNAGDTPTSWRVLEEAEIIAEQLGNDGVLFLVHSLQVHSYGLMMAGESAQAIADRALDLAPRSGNQRARLLAAGAAAAAFVETNPSRATELFSEVAALAPRVQSRHMAAAAYGYLALLTCGDDPRRALVGLSEMLDMYQRVASPLGLRFMVREWLFAFSQLGRHEVVAIIDGATYPVTLWPRREAAAIEAACLALGSETFDEAKLRGASMTNDDFGELIQRELR